MCCWVHIVVSFLYLDLYVLGNGLSMSVIVHANKALCVLNHIRVKGEVGVVEHVLALCFFMLSILWPYYICESFLLFMFYVFPYYTVLYVTCIIVISCCERADF